MPSAHYIRPPQQVPSTTTSRSGFLQSYARLSISSIYFFIHLHSVPAFFYLQGATRTEDCRMDVQKFQDSHSLTAEHYRWHRQQLAEKGTIKKHHAISTKNNIKGIKKRWK
jgi:hypothetical protein